MSPRRALIWMAVLAFCAALLASCTSAAGPPDLAATVTSEMISVSSQTGNGPSRTTCLYRLTVRLDGPAGRWLQLDHAQVRATAPGSVPGEWEQAGTAYFPPSGRVFTGEERSILRWAEVYPAADGMAVTYTWWAVDDRGEGSRIDHIVTCSEETP